MATGWEESPRIKSFGVRDGTSGASHRPRRCCQANDGRGRARERSTRRSIRWTDRRTERWMQDPKLEVPAPHIGKMDVLGSDGKKNSAVYGRRPAECEGAVEPQIHVLPGIRPFMHMAHDGQASPTWALSHFTHPCQTPVADICPYSRPRCNSPPPSPSSPPSRVRRRPARFPGSMW